MIISIISIAFASIIFILGCFIIGLIIYAQLAENKNPTPKLTDKAPRFSEVVPYLIKYRKIL